MKNTGRLAGLEPTSIGCHPELSNLGIRPSALTFEATNDTLYNYNASEIPFYLTFYYPTELFPYVKPKIHNRCNDTNLQRMKNKQNVFVGHLYHE